MFESKQDAVAALSALIERLWDATGNRNRVALVSDRGYMVFSTRGRHRSVVVQTAGGRNLPDGVKLTPTQAQTLGGYGLYQRRASGDFQQEIKRDNRSPLGSLVDSASTILEEVYGTPPEMQRLVSRFETVPVVENAEVEEAMNHLARQRDWPARTGLYMKMVKAQLICAVESDEPKNDQALLKPYHVGMIGSFPTVAIFTSYEALDRYSAVGLPARVLSGAELFPALLALKVGSVLVNPKGEPRGEFYNNELHIIVDGIKRLQGVH